MLLNCVYSLALFLSAPEALSVQQYSAEHDNAALYVLPSRQGSVPSIVILDDRELSLYPANSRHALFSHVIDDNTLMFDLVDTDADGRLELFTLSPDMLKHYGGNDAEETLFPIEPMLPWKVDKPFLHSLVIEYLDAYHVAIPHLDHIRLMNFSGEEVTTFPKVATGADPVFSIPIQPNRVGGAGALEFRVDAFLSTPIEVPQSLRSTSKRDSYETVTPRKLRDSEKLEVELWPQFPLTVQPDSMRMVSYASHGPEHVNTLIRIKQPVPRSVPNVTEAFRYSPARMYPGTIAIAESGLPDFNKDGYFDMVLWSVPLPGYSTAKLMNSLQTQRWPLVLTVHLFDPEKGLYVARPKARIRTEIALQYLFTRQSSSPLHNLSFADMNHDGTSDVVFSPTPNSVEVWLYNNGFEAEPQYRNMFKDTVSMIAVPEHDKDYESHSLLMRDESSIYRLNISDR